MSSPFSFLNRTFILFIVCNCGMNGRPWLHPITRIPTQNERGWTKNDKNINHLPRRIGIPQSKMEYIACGLATYNISIVVSARPRTWFPDQTKSRWREIWSGTLLIIYIFPETPTVFPSMVGVLFLSYRFLNSIKRFLHVRRAKPLIAKV